MHGNQMFIEKHEVKNLGGEQETLQEKGTCKVLRKREEKTVKGGASGTFNFILK
jgi:hypothetical protein